MSLSTPNTFSTLPLSPALVAALPVQCQAPTSIQSLAIPAISARKDVLAIAQTGSGKTLAYGLPLLDGAQATASQVCKLVLVPTRELAAQVNEALTPIATALNLSTVVICGGIEKESQIERLLLKPEVVIATPGRLKELLKEGALETSTIDSVVLDEADRLVDMGFWPDVENILAAIPTSRQMMLFSATLPEELEASMKGLLNSPATIFASATNSMVKQIEERLYLVNKGSKANVLIDQIKQQDWPQVLVFISARDNADALCKKLNKAGVTSAALHGDKAQSEREQTLAAFKDKQVQVLIATDLLARGIHIDHLPVVINFDVPLSPAVYVHRVGRTARAGEQGLAITLVCHAETNYLQAIRNMIKRELPLHELEAFPVTDKPSTGDSKRAPRDKQANRRTSQKSSIKQFKSKPTRR
ncbi:DEAD/DEAH box helicase [Enterovibrio norvegicus]|uniref:DEAD/DEAH box helicase n=1 Tax=Enterovibrio norvegicus TaxID=188144 RepID=UPI000C81D99C|nr:DEAD/DEAH box helicase [Enterovibrio norvegicus]MCC4799274.1 DEAD/DEAH box helicase [Enterovibrio norvegicus]PMI29075.1 DEAD/DEAH box helicase [Enterovibrio norvegicus]PMI35405.1 DEAD/DEAH box helicase [Enterovibrio norvegicus]PMN47224.1 DEAD/DEAH box helicase [Enterovibrio norvegicus]TKF10221.1 DEAD/DEAH box helicase [Enterovibrio norvegicus]